MRKKIINILCLVIFFSFTILITKYYFSEKNIIFINKSRSSHMLESNINSINLPVLKNDTEDIIVYVNGLEDFNKKRKKRIWERLISNNE